MDRELWETMVRALECARIKEELEREEEREEALRKQQRTQKLQQLQQEGKCLRCEFRGDCAKCGGEGRCAACKGRGTQTKQIKSQDPLKQLGSWLGFTESTENVEVECKSCQGTGICQDCNGTGECQFCQGSGYADPTQAPKYWIIKDGVRFDVSHKQAFDFVNKERGTVRVNGKEIVQSGHDLLYAEWSDGHHVVRCGFDETIIILRGEAVDAGLQVVSFHNVLNERQKTIGITGELVATKVPLSSNNVTYELKEQDPGNGKFGKGKLDIPLTEVGGSTRFQVPCPNGVRLLLILSVVDSSIPANADRRGKQEDSRPKVIFDEVTKQTFKFGEPQWDGDTLKMLVTFRDSTHLIDRSKQQFCGAFLHWNGYDRQGIKIIGEEYVEMPDLKLGETGRAVLDVGNAAEGNMAELASIEIKIDEGEVIKVAPTPPDGKDQTDQWYYAKDKQRLGPFTTEQMRQLASAGAIQPTDMVLKEGAKNWQQASSIGELTFPTPAAAVPPPPATRWYYARDGKAFGPVTLEEVRRLIASGQLQPADFLCREGTQTWVSVKSVQPL